MPNHYIVRTQDSTYAIGQSYALRLKDGSHAPQIFNLESGVAKPVSGERMRVNVLSWENGAYGTVTTSRVEYVLDESNSTSSGALLAALRLLEPHVISDGEEEFYLDPSVASRLEAEDSDSLGFCK